MILNYMEKKRTEEPGMARFLSALRPACCTDTSPSATCCSNRSRIWGTTPNSSIFTQLLSKSKKRGNFSYKSDILEKVGVIQTKPSLKNTIFISSPFLAKLAMARAPDNCSSVFDDCSQERTSWYTIPFPSPKHFCIDSSVMEGRC